MFFLPTRNSKPLGAPPSHSIWTLVDQLYSSGMAQSKSWGYHMSPKWSQVGVVVTWPFWALYKPATSWNQKTIKENTLKSIGRRKLQNRTIFLIDVGLPKKGIKTGGFNSISRPGNVHPDAATVRSPGPQQKSVTVAMWLGEYPEFWISSFRRSSPWGLSHEQFLTSWNRWVLRPDLPSPRDVWPQLVNRRIHLESLKIIMLQVRMSAQINGSCSISRYYMVLPDGTPKCQAITT